MGQLPLFPRSNGDCWFENGRVVGKLGDAPLVVSYFISRQGLLPALISVIEFGFPQARIVQYG